ncbi:hypothetical protein FOL47_008782 [Perkinsus chesapeaki]|uniref:Uncharacterized protein n=1 Tax=Perkinsus chesapeaki TaxID=330153 RepID=A0A7J6MT17_PERCH|nr:hypothetical protein FOL47_008782 [Perkinsus chesapeaki]
MRLIFHNPTPSTSDKETPQEDNSEEEDFEAELKARDTDLDELKASLASTREDLNATAKKLTGDLGKAEGTIESQKRELVCAQDLYKFSSEQCKLIADYWQGQAAMKDQNIAFFNQKLADAEAGGSTAKGTVIGHFKEPATAKDELECLQDRHDKLLVTCLKLERELHRLRQPDDDRREDHTDGSSVASPNSTPSQSSSRSVSLRAQDDSDEDDEAKSSPSPLKRSTSEPSCLGGTSESSCVRRASSVDLQRAPSSFASITSDSSEEEDEVAEAVQNLHHCTWRAQLGVRVQQLERLSKQLDDTYNTSLNLGDQLRQQSEQILKLQGRVNELEVSEKKWQKVGSKAQTQLGICLASLTQQTSEMDQLALKQNDHRLARSATAWKAKVESYRKEIENMRTEIEDAERSAPDGSRIH